MCRPQTRIVRRDSVLNHYKILTLNFSLDNLYMDLNTLAHLALHNNSDAHLQKMSRADSFHEVWASVCADIDTVVRLVRPQKTLFLAMDGVTPRAKLHDQKRRRLQIGVGKKAN